MTSRRRWFLVALCPLACVGAIDAHGPSDSETPDDPSSPRDPGGSPAGPGQGGGAAPGTGSSAKPGDPNAAGPRPLRRLSQLEYNNTIRDLLGNTSRPADQFPQDRDATFAFRRAGVVAVQDATVLRTAAETLAATATRNLGAVLPCDPAAAGETPCARQFVETFGLRAYRRALATTEINRLMDLYTAGRGTLKLAFADAIGLLLETMLQSPFFLYHWETPPGAPVVKEGAVLRLSHYEVASRLSYFLWATMPDRELFAAAAAGKLGTPAELEAHARRMLADPKARETVAAFFEEWLDLDALRDKPKDLKLYPQYTDTLKAAMAAEARAFAQNVVFDGDGRWGTLLSASFSFVNEPLAAVYGVTVRGTTLQRSELNPSQRQGFLTQPGFLALTGATDGSHPVRRGNAVFEKLLCRELPPPPGEVPPAKPASAGGTTRERFSEHDQNECAKACHALIDPIGFAFENYDGIGRYRTMDNGRPVDATGAIALDGASRKFANALELTALLAQGNEARRCFATQLVRFALLRPEVEADRASIDAAAAAFSRTESTVRDLMGAITTSRSFRYRSPSPGEVLP